MSDTKGILPSVPASQPVSETKTTTTTERKPLPGMVSQNYKRAFTFTYRDGSTKLVRAGQQDVPQEVADNPYAQSFLIDRPAHMLEAAIPYGEPGHEVQAFENRNLGPDEPLLGAHTTAGQGVEADSEEEIPQPGEKGLSTRVATGRRRAVASD